ncbi:MAG: 2-amino-4-hydroxy-6-hydroxymethyldihydropteridine diphosphokinase [Gammaproteobacteria bacterium]|nr:MAG: 2-amino-4-hydroxy-6-hydroxymethyldihydropteridine diphosphokinase [Gammaproteobacteria bacterium]
MARCNIVERAGYVHGVFWRMEARDCRWHAGQLGCDPGVRVGRDLRDGFCGRLRSEIVAVMQRLLFALGSNVRPGRHVPWAIEKMAASFSCLIVGKFYRTRPMAIKSCRRFWNGAVLAESRMSVSEIKRMLCAWERESGRDRSHPDCSWRDRTLDIDILWSDCSGWITPREAIEKTPYLALPATALLPIKWSRISNTRVLNYSPACFIACGKLLGLRPVRLK